MAVEAEGLSKWGMLVAETNSDLADFPVSPENFSRFLNEVFDSGVFKGEALIDEMREAAASVFANKRTFHGGWDEFFDDFSAAFGAGD